MYPAPFLQYGFAFQGGPKRREIRHLDEEALILWQDVLDEIIAGRTGNLSCPHCRHQPLEVATEEMRTRVSCTRCGEFIEGSFGAL